MLVIDDRFITMEGQDPVLSMIFSVLSEGKESRRVATGIYEIGHFGSSGFPPRSLYFDTFDDWEYFEEHPLGVGIYGVCDDYQQILDSCPEIENSSTRRFVITLTPIVKAEQPEYGGWRWHKWGPYIGTQAPQFEYIYDEPNIEKVYVYHIYEQRV